jgi:hypothetical protein
MPCHVADIAGAPCGWRTLWPAILEPRADQYSELSISFRLCAAGRSGVRLSVGPSAVPSLLYLLYLLHLLFKCLGTAISVVCSTPLYVSIAQVSS